MNSKILQTVLLASSLVYLQGCFWHSRTVVERDTTPTAQTTVHHHNPSGSSVDVTTTR